MNEVYKCPKCQQYILADYCYSCKIDIKNSSDFLKEFFGIFDKENNKDK